LDGANDAGIEPEFGKRHAPEMPGEWATMRG
jgi:hypothetical protein